jgi:hypothetical protein
LRLLPTFFTAFLTAEADLRVFFASYRTCEKQERSERALSEEVGRLLPQHEGTGGHIAAGQLSDEDMKALMTDVVDCCFDFLMQLCSPLGVDIIGALKRRDELPEWSDPVPMIRLSTISSTTLASSASPMPRHRQEGAGPVRCRRIRDSWDESEGAYLIRP